ncbi:MAG: hydroxymethylbilane synthase [Phycisphaeraceae bacterium]
MIASRRSRLARIQAELVGGALARLHPRVAVEYRWIESEGDRTGDTALADRGGKGLFTRALEQAVLKGEADLAVHSLKDLPARDTPGLNIAAIPRRADVHDCLIARDGARTIQTLAEHAIVGTSSPRRAAQLLRLRPDLRVVPLRGNVETRLDKVLQPAPGAPQQLDATLLAAAGLHRLGVLDAAHHHAVPVEQVLPAACQGALAIQCRTDDHVTLTRCLPLNDPAAATAVHAERTVLAELGASCYSPISVLAEPAEPAEPPRRQSDAHWFRLRARVLSDDGQVCLDIDQKTRSKDLRRLVKQTIKQLIDQGARRLLTESRGVRPATSTSSWTTHPEPAAPTRLG